MRECRSLRTRGRELEKKRPKLHPKSSHIDPARCSVCWRCNDEHKYYVLIDGETREVVTTSPCHSAPLCRVFFLAKNERSIVHRILPILQSTEAVPVDAYRLNRPVSVTNVKISRYCRVTVSVSVIVDMCLMKPRSKSLPGVNVLLDGPVGPCLTIMDCARTLSTFWSSVRIRTDTNNNERRTV